MYRSALAVLSKAAGKAQRDNLLGVLADAEVCVSFISVLMRHCCLARRISGTSCRILCQAIQLSAGFHFESTWLVLACAGRLS